MKIASSTLMGFSNILQRVEFLSTVRVSTVVTKMFPPTFNFTTPLAAPENIDCSRSIKWVFVSSRSGRESSKPYDCNDRTNKIKIN